MKYLLPILTLLYSTAFAQDRFVGYVISFDGTQIVYDIHSNRSKPPSPDKAVIVLVHGWSCDRTYWREQAEAFGKNFKVVSMDLAGHGGSGPGRKVFSMESFGEDVAAVVNKLQLQKVVLVGHSMGGDVIAEAAKLLPGRVAGLVMVDTYKKLGPGRSPEEVDAFKARLRYTFKDSTKALVKSMFVPASDPALVERVSEDMSSAPSRVALSALEHALNYSRQMPQTLEELKLPVIAINADNAPTDMASMKKYGVEVMIMKGVGHFGMMEDAARFNTMLVTALQKVTK